MGDNKGFYLLVLQLMAAAGLLMIEIADAPLQMTKWALFMTLFFINGHLWVRSIHFRKRLELIAAELRRAVNGNVKTRLFAKDDPLFNELIFSMNELIEQLERVHVQTIKSETARKRLLSSISHDIRTPLTSIIGYIDALKDDIAASEEEKREYLEIIGKKSNSLKQLIDDIFNMAKLDADEIPLKLEVLDFSEIARESLIECLPDLKKHGMELNVHIPEKESFIMADRLSLMRIIANIMKNAVHYGKDGKVLGIELMETSHEYELVISDKGPGIAQPDLENVFERMYRSDQSRNLLDGGSGLGLAIAKALVEKHGGRIWAESIPWEKTAFGFSIPKPEHPNPDLRNN